MLPREWVGALTSSNMFRKNRRSQKVDEEGEVEWKVGQLPSVMLKSPRRMKCEELGREWKEWIRFSYIVGCRTGWG